MLYTSYILSSLHFSSDTLKGTFIMAKRIIRTKQTLGTLTVVSEAYETQVYTIAAIEGNSVWLTWFEGPHQCVQWTDRDSLYFPSLEQIECSIRINGRLASLTDVYQYIDKHCATA